MKNEYLEIEPDFDLLGMQMESEMLQLPGPTPMCPPPQRAALRPVATWGLHGEAACWPADVCVRTRLPLLRPILLRFGA